MELILPAGRQHCVLGSTQTLTEIGASDISCRLKRPALMANNFHPFVYQFSRNFGKLKLLEPPVPAQAPTVITLLSPLLKYI